MVESLSSQLRYGFAGLDRAAAQRSDETWIEQLLGHSSTRLLPNWRYRHAVRYRDGDVEALALRATEAAPLVDAAELVIFLGLDRGSAVFALDLDAADDRPLAELDGRFEDLRRVGPLLDSRQASMLADARGMIYWHRNHRFCSRCGGPTALRQSGHVRRCEDPECRRQSFPRTDPAVIMLVEHHPEDGSPPRCLLGRGPKWPPGSFSTLAGFVEPGESLEEAVAREVLEEAGVTVDQATYRGSQPWPFPSSLMLGFRARARNTELRLDPDELADAAWLTAEELESFGEWGDDSAERRLPRRDSIARQLVDEWLAEQRTR